MTNTTTTRKPTQRDNFNEIRESDELKAILRDGAERANAIAEKTMKRVRDKFGLGF